MELTINGEYTITSLKLDKENFRYIGTAICPDKEEKPIIIDFSEYFEYDPISDEMVQKKEKQNA